MSRIQSVNLRSLEASAFYPQHAPQLEAPYIHAVSAPSLPEQQLVHTRRTELAQLERRRLHVQKAAEETARLEKKKKLRLAQIEMERKKEQMDAWHRMHMDKSKREARWTHKTAGSPFSVDLWTEDVQVYELNQADSAYLAQKRRDMEKGALKDQAGRRRAKVDEIDHMGILRSEKKKLQENHKELRARLGLAKVDERCAEAQYKVDIKTEAHQQMLANKGHLNRSHSDFFTEGRLSPTQREEQAKHMATRAQRESLRSGSSGSLGRSGTAMFDGSAPSVASPKGPEAFLASIAKDLTPPSTADANKDQAAETLSERPSLVPSVTSSEPFSSPLGFRAAPGDALA